MPPALVQSASATGSSLTSLTVTLSSTTAGNCLVAGWAVSTSITCPQVSGVTLGGSAGNWAAAATAGAAGSSGVYNLAAWCDPNCAGGQTSVVFTSSGGSGSAATVAWVLEFSGLLTASVLDAAPAGVQSSGTSWASSATGALASANELAVGFTAAGSTPTGPGSPWSSTSVAGSSPALVAGYQALTSAASLSYAGTQASNSSFSAVIITLKAVIPPYTPAAGPAFVPPGWFPGAPAHPQDIPFLAYPPQQAFGGFPQIAASGADASTASDAGESLGVSPAVSPGDTAAAADNGEQVNLAFIPPRAAAAPPQPPGWFPGSPAPPGGVPFGQYPVPAYFPGANSVSDADSSAAADAGEALGVSPSGVPDDASTAADAGEQVQSVIFATPAPWQPPPGWFPGAPGAPGLVPFAVYPGSWPSGVRTVLDGDVSTALENELSKWPASSDTSTAADAGEAVQSSLSSSDTAHGTDAGESLGVSPAASPGDASTAADAGEHVLPLVSDADASHLTESGFAWLSDAEASAAADSQFLSPGDADASRALEGELSKWPADGDSSLVGVAEQGVWSGPLASADSSAAAEAFQVSVADSDASTALDLNPVIGIDPFFPAWVYSSGGARLYVIWVHPVTGRVHARPEALLTGADHQVALAFAAGAVTFCQDLDASRGTEGQDWPETLLAVSAAVVPAVQVVLEVS